MIYVMSDIHGFDTRYRSVLRQIKLKKSDHLYILGDVIDRFPDGLGILRETMKKDNITLIMGNHEHMMLEALSEPGTSEEIWRWHCNGGDVTHDRFNHCTKAYREEILAYIRSLPTNIEIKVNGVDYLLVHGAPASTYTPLSRYSDITTHMVWTRLNRGDQMPEGKTVIFGHTPTKQYQRNDPMSIYYGNRMIGIDCGCAWGYDGRLGCLRLDDMQEFYSEDGL